MQASAEISAGILVFLQRLKNAKKPKLELSQILP